MPADPVGFDYYRRGETLQGQRAKVDETGFDYYRRGEPLSVEVLIVSGGPGFIASPERLALQAVNRSSVY